MSKLYYITALSKNEVKTIRFSIYITKQLPTNFPKKIQGLYVSRETYKPCLIFIM